MLVKGNELFLGNNKTFIFSPCQMSICTTPFILKRNSPIAFTKRGGNSCGHRG